MSDKYDISNYTRAALPRTYNAQIRALVETAIGVGWTLYVARNQNCTLVSPKGEKTIPLNPRQHSKPITSLLDTVKRHANPLLAIDANKVEERTKQMSNAVTARTNTEVTQLFQAETVVEAVKKADEMVAEAGGNPNDIVLYDGPMRSQQSNGNRYESDVATEVEYGDGRRIFTCVRCGWQTDKTPRAMSAHWQKHTNEDAKAKGGHYGPRVDTVPVGDYEPRRERVESLAEAFREVFAAGDVDWSDLGQAAETLASHALTWEHERRLKGEPREPLTDSQVVDRIRHLVDGGKYAERQAEIEGLKGEVAALQIQSERLQEERDEARNNLKALRELLNGLDKDDE